MNTRLLAFTIAFTCAPLAAQQSNAELAERLHLYLTRLEPLGFSGTALVMTGREIVLERGYGLAQRAGKLSMEVDTAMPLGSISKQFTAVAIMRLVMASKLSPQDSLAEIFEQVPADKRGITVHQLLTHTSGLPAFRSRMGVCSSAAELVQAAMTSELVFAPGEGEEYSNIGYGLLAAIVEHKSGRPFEQFLREEIFVPAGMQATGITTPERAPGLIAHGYIDGQDSGAIDASWKGAPWHLLGAGGVRTTLPDMARWELALRDETVLDAKILELMTTAHVPHGGGFGTGYGCGISSTERGSRKIGHDGSNDVFGADWGRFVDEDVMMFVATNDADLYAMDVTPQLERLIFGADVPMPPELIELSTADYAPYVGEYRLEDGGAISVAIGTKGLVFSSSHPEAAKLLHPLGEAQERRREELMVDLPQAYEQAFEGEFGGLHQLLDGFSPAAEFKASQLARMTRMQADNGAFELAHGVPGRNRFGEIAIVVVLGFERGEVMIEYSFGEREIGSIRFLSEFPARALCPASETEFLDFDLETGASWALLFELDADDVPRALLLKPARDDGVVRAVR